METNDQSTFDLQVLVQGYVNDLRAAAQSSKRNESAPSEGNAQLRQSVGRVQARREEAVAELNGRYRARTGAMEAVITERRRRLEAYARRQRQAVPVDPDRFIVAGRITDQATGQGLPHVRVRATDLDRRYDDVVGEARTDVLGYYRIEYTAASIAERDRNPETYIEVLDDSGQVLFTSTKSFIQKAGQSAFIPAAVDGDKLPTSMRMAGKVTDSVIRRQNDLERRGRLLQYRPRIEAAEASAWVRPTPARPRKKGPAREEGAIDAQSVTPPEGNEKPEPAADTQRRAVPERPLTDVKGIGAVFKERLQKAGVTTIQAVAAMKPARLADMLETGAERAQRIIAAAQDV